MIRTFLYLSALLLISGCVSPQRKTTAPPFNVQIRQPVAIRLLDQRPEVQKVSLRDDDYLYHRSPGLTNPEVFVQYLGNALTMFQAAPGYRLVGGETRPRDVPVLIDIEYLQGYARWPLNVNQRNSHVPVEGLVEVRYEVFVNGKRVDKGGFKEHPRDLEIPVSVITAGNVQKVVTESLAHQFDKATTDLLEDFLWELSEVWPEKR